MSLDEPLGEASRCSPFTQLEQSAAPSPPTVFAWYFAAVTKTPPARPPASSHLGVKFKCRRPDDDRSDKAASLFCSDL